MTLSQYQQKFAQMVGLLIAWTYQNGYGLTFGEAYRTPAQAQLDAQAGTGIADSLHCLRLAVDLNLFKDGQYLMKTSDYEPLGVYWESIGGAWGGRFHDRPDGNHFSLEYQGRR